MSGIISNRGKRTMRVAYLTADFGVPVLGTKGASSHVRGFLEALRSQGHDLFVLTANIGDDADPSFPLRHVLFGSTLMEMYDALQNESICADARPARERLDHAGADGKSVSL